MNFRKFLIIEELDLFEAPTIQGLNIDPEHPASVYIDPKTGKPWRIQDKIRQLRTIRDRLESKGKKSEDLWVQFSEIAKLGVNPKAKYGGTPLGVYAYPLNYVIDTEGKVPFFGQRRFMLIFEAKKDESILKVDDKPADLDDFIKNLNKSIIYLARDAVNDFKSKIADQLTKTMGKIKNSNFKSLPRDNFSHFRDQVIGLMLSNLRKLETEKGNEEPNLEEIKNTVLQNSEDLFSESSAFEKIKTGIQYITIKSYSPNSGWSSPVDFYKSIKYDNKNVIAELSEEAIEKLNSLEYSEEDFPYNKKYHTVEDIKKIIDRIEYGIFKQDKYQKDASDNLLLVETPGYRISEKIRYGMSSIELLNNSRIVERIKSTIRILRNSLFKKLDEINKKIQESADSVDFPFKKEFLDYIKKKNLDWMTIIRKTARFIRASNFDTGESTTSVFVYRLAQAISDEMAHKETEKRFGTYDVYDDKEENNEKKHFILKLKASYWTRVLREMGVKGITDQTGLGAIHKGEPKQGAFFDARKYNLLGIIENNPFSGRNSYSHAISKIEKRAPKEQMKFDPNQTNLERWFEGINDALLHFFEGVYSKTHKTVKLGGVLWWTENLARKESSYVGKFAKLVKSYIREKNKNQQQVEEFFNKNLIKDIDKKIKEILINFRTRLEEIKKSSSGDKKNQIIQMYEKLLSSMTQLGY